MVASNVNVNVNINVLIALHARWRHRAQRGTHIPRTSNLQPNPHLPFPFPAKQNILTRPHTTPQYLTMQYP